MINVRQFQELHEGICDTLYDEMIHTVSVCEDLDPIEVEGWNSEKLITHFNKWKYVVKTSKGHNENIIVGGIDLKLIPFTSLTLGQFIDLESLVNDGFIANIHKIASSIYLACEGGEWEEITIEKYGNVNIDYRSKIIQEMQANEVIGACYKYLDFRKNFFDSYELFQNPFEGVNPEEMDDEELALYEEEKRLHEEKGGNQWSDILNILSLNDITKFPTVLEMNLFMCFNQVSWIKSNEK